jgi:hypothetical protein
VEIQASVLPKFLPSTEKCNRRVLKALYDVLAILEAATTHPVTGLEYLAVARLGDRISRRSKLSRRAGRLLRMMQRLTCCVIALSL